MGAHDQLQIGLRRESDRVIVSLEGELDMANAPLLQSQIEGPELEGVGTVVLDLQKLEFSIRPGCGSSSPRASCAGAVGRSSP